MGKKKKKQNYLNLRRGPETDFVIGEHRNEFEQWVLDQYMFIGPEICSNGMVPAVEDIAIFFRNKFAFAGLLSINRDDPTAYQKEVIRFDNPETEELFCHEMLQRTYRANPDKPITQYIFQAAVEDIQSVLDYHKMFYAFDLPKKHPLLEQSVLRNFPLVEVW